MDPEFCNGGLNSETGTATIAVNGYRGRSGVVSKRSWKTITTYTHVLLHMHVHTLHTQGLWTVFCSLALR